MKQKMGMRHFFATFQISHLTRGEYGKVKSFSLFFRETKVCARVYKHHLTKPRPAPHTSKNLPNAKILTDLKTRFSGFPFPFFPILRKFSEKAVKSFLLCPKIKEPLVSPYFIVTFFKSFFWGKRRQIAVARNTF